MTRQPLLAIVALAWIPPLNHNFTTSFDVFYDSINRPLKAFTPKKKIASFSCPFFEQPFTAWSTRQRSCPLLELLLWSALAQHIQQVWWCYSRRLTPCLCFVLALLASHSSRLRTLDLLSIENFLIGTAARKAMEAGVEQSEVLLPFLSFVVLKKPIVLYRICFYATYSCR